RPRPAVRGALEIRAAISAFFFRSEVRGGVAIESPVESDGKLRLSKRRDARDLDVPATESETINVAFVDDIGLRIRKGDDVHFDRVAGARRVRQVAGRVAQAERWRIEFDEMLCRGDAERRVALHSQGGEVRVKLFRD